MSARLEQHPVPCHIGAHLENAAARLSVQKNRRWGDEFWGVRPWRNWAHVVLRRSSPSNGFTHHPQRPQEPF